MNTPVRPWRKNYRAVYGALTEPQAYEWEEFIRASVESVSLLEMNEAMAALCDDRQPTKPDVRQLVRKIMTRRRGQSISMAERDAALCLAMEGVRDARTPREAWACVCMGKLDVNDRMDVLSHVQRTRPDLCEDGDLKERDKWTVTLQEVLHELFRVTKEGPDGTATDRDQSEEARPGDNPPPVQDRPGHERPPGNPPVRRRTRNQGPPA